MKNRTRFGVSILVSVIVLGGFSLPVSAGIIAGVSGSTILGADVSGQLTIRLGSGLATSTLTYAYVTVKDTLSATYFTNFQIIRCPTNVSDFSTCSANHWIAASDATHYYTVAQTGIGKRTIQIDFSSRWFDNGASTVFGTGGVPIDPAYWYFLYVQTSNSTTSGAVNGTTQLYGIIPTLTDAVGTPIQCRYGSSGGTLCNSSIGTPYYFLSDSPLLVGQDYGFAVAASASSGVSLSGATAFCSSVFEDSTFGIMSGLCRVLTYLFIPSQDSLNNFSSAKDILKTKIPYSYFYDIQTLTGSISSSSGTFPSITVPFNLGLGQSHASISLFSLSAVQYYLPAGSMTIFRTLMAYSLWFTFMLFVWRTIRHIV